MREHNERIRLLGRGHYRTPIVHDPRFALDRPIATLLLPLSDLSSSLTLPINVGVTAGLAQLHQMKDVGVHDHGQYITRT